jgi:protein-disulfide isomerase
MRILARIVTFAVLTALSMAGYGADASSLKLPPGVRVAIVMFEDLECPDCARAYPLVWEVANAHKVPVLLHDFPLNMHPWSFDAAVYARYFDTKSQKLGDDFRGFIFSNQPQITKQNLLEYVQKFANDNKTPLPFAPDPDGKLKQKVIDDRTLGTKIGLQHTPTIFVIGNGGAATPPVEVTDRGQLGQIVEDMLQKVPPAKPAAKPASTKARKKAAH